MSRQYIINSKSDRKTNNKNVKLFSELLGYSDIQLNGTRPWDIIVKNDALYQRVLSQGSIGFGEAYMDEWWKCDAIDEFIFRIFREQIDLKDKINWKLVLSLIKAKLFNRQSIKRSFTVAEKHYNLDNTLFERMLDKRMVYSCGYWKNASNLEEAQKNKLQLICDKLQLKSGMRILDIGSGWGSFIKFASENYDVECVGITISKEQVKYTEKSCKGLNIDVRLLDYRELNEKFDRIVSVGMIEHVGPKNYRTYMKSVNRCLTDDGLFLLHTIGSKVSRNRTNPWIDKYIFPNGVLPSIKQLGEAIEGLFIIEDLHNFSADYDLTLMAWYNNFNSNWDILKLKYDERFYRMWEYYLLTCAGTFRARVNQLWQIVMSKNGILGGYTPVI